jgi:hypothetical protein
VQSVKMLHPNNKLLMNKILALLIFISMDAYAATDSLPENASVRKEVAGNSGSIVRSVCRAGLSSALPLYIIDGCLSDARAIGQLDANKIESIAFVKPPSSLSLFGSRGVNGIVIIRTKSANKRILIKDSLGDLPLAGASIKMNGVSGSRENSFAADENGMASIRKLKTGESRDIEVSCIGYKSKTVPLVSGDNSDTQVVRLEKDYRQLEKVVVTGYLYSRKCCCWGGVISNNYLLASRDSAGHAIWIFPNPVPASGAFSIVVPMSMKGLVHVINSNGQTVRSSPLEADKDRLLRYDPGQLSAGVYFLRLIDTRTKKTFTEKIIVQ